MQRRSLDCNSKPIPWIVSDAIQTGSGCYGLCEATAQPPVSSTRTVSLRLKQPLPAYMTSDGIYGISLNCSTGSAAAATAVLIRMEIYADAPIGVSSKIGHSSVDSQSYVAFVIEVRGTQA